MTTDVVLDASDLSKRYHRRFARRDLGDIVGVREVSLRLAAGEFVVLSGPSGSGKTSLLNLLTGFEVADVGVVVWRGDQPFSVAASNWAELAVVPQSLGLLDELSILENIALPLRMAKVPPPETVRTPAELIERLGIAHITAHYPREASLGEQQRAAIARALVLGSRLVVLDEPTAHQDERSRHRVLNAMLDAAWTGSAVIAASHDAAVHKSRPSLPSHGRRRTHRRTRRLPLELTATPEREGLAGRCRYSPETGA